MNANAKLLLSSLLFLGGSLSKSFAQSDFCEQLSVAQGVWGNNWVATSGKQTNGTVNTGFITDRHQIWPSSAGFVSFITAEKIPVVPPGFDYSIQLGNTDASRQWEALKFTLPIDDSNTMLIFQIAVFLENKGAHSAAIQPKFEFRVSDPSGNDVPCAYYYVVAGAQIPGFKTQNTSGAPIRYLPWTEIAVDVRKFAGQTITIKLKTSDCNATSGDHFGMALFTARCQKAEITATVFCPSVSNSITLTAPGGFKEYVWSTGQKKQSITVQNPQPGETFSVKCKPYSDLTGQCEVSLDYTVPDAPYLSAPDSVAMCDGTPASVTATASPGYTNFQWSHVATGATVSLSSEGTYTVTATDAAGNCPLTKTVTAVVKPLPQYHMDAQDAPCFGRLGSATCIPDSASGTSYTYSWSNQTTSSSLQNPYAGTYTVTATTADGCSTTQTVTIGQPPEKIVTVTGPTAKCPEKSLNLTAEGDFVQYEWSNGTKIAQNTIVQPGTYTVTATDIVGCTFSENVTVTDHPQPQAQITGNATVCQNATVPLTAQPPGMATYAWSNGATTAAQSAGSGAYTVTVTNEFGCFSLDTFVLTEVPLRTATLTADSVVCPGAGAKVTLNVSGSSANGTVRFLTSLNEISQIPLVGGTALLNFIPANSLTVSVDSIFIPGYECPFIMLVKKVEVRVNWVAGEISVDKAIQCPGFSNGVLAAKVLQGRAPYTYLWNTGSTAHRIEGLPTGIYTVTVTDARGCTGVYTTQLQDPLRLAPTIDVHPPLCFNNLNGGSIAVGSIANAQTAQVWFSVDGVRKQVPGRITGLGPGKHVVRVWDGICEIDTTYVFDTPPGYHLSLPQVIKTLEFGDSVRLEPQTNIPFPVIQKSTWEGSPIFNDLHDFQTWARPSHTSNILLTVVTIEGCALSAAATLYVDPTRLIYAPNVFSPNGDGENDRFMIFPKPSAVKAIRQFAVFDRLGELLWKSQSDLRPLFEDSMGWDGRFRGKLCQTGVYVWQAEIEFFDGSREVFKGDVTIVK